MADPSNFTGNFSIFRQTQQFFCDAAGQNSAFWGGNNNLLWAQSWEDDLILTGVRSFDVKAYDDALANYADLGWGDDLRLYLPYVNARGRPSSQARRRASPARRCPWPGRRSIQSDHADLQHPQHVRARGADAAADQGQSGRRPVRWGGGGLLRQQLSRNYTGNIGDNTPGIVRLRRVWDSWSTEYSRAPGTGVAKLNGGFPIGPPFSPPVYPSYPPPYPAPLRGIQIQIRVVDPTNQRIKSLTIRQDFTDRL